MFETLAALTKKEYADLGLFLQSPYFNRNEVCFRVWEALEDRHPHYESVDKMALVQKLYPRRRIDRQFATDRLGELARLAEQFLIQQQLKKQPETLLSLQLEALKEKRLPKRYTKKLDKTLQELHARAPLHWKDSLHLW